MVRVLTLKEERSLIRNQVSSKVLGGIDQASDERPPKISALEQIHESRRATNLSLDLDGTLHHGQRVVDILLRFAAEAQNGLASFFNTSAADKPPGRLRSEPDQDEERCLSSISRGQSSFVQDSLTGKIHCRANGTLHAHSSLRWL